MTDRAETAVELVDAQITLGSVRALDGMSFAVERGEMFGLVGPDGAGKTTAIRVLLGLLPLTGGKARVSGHDPAGETGVVKREVGYLSQRFTLYGDLTVAENIAFAAEIRGVRDFEPRRETLLDFTRLGPFRTRRADKLSGGMQKKLALACTLVHTPKVLFLDEPTTGVDPVSRREFWSLLTTLVGEGLTVLLTTPYLDEAERCTRVALVRTGRTLACDTPQSLRDSFGSSVIEVVCEPLRQAKRALEHEPRVREVQLFGDRLHVVAREPEDALTDVLEHLPGVQVTRARAIAPSLEDVFIRRVGEAGPDAPAPPA